jgi:uroporphyrin-III C-methyltransferase
MKTPAGKVYLIGAGPGDPELLTVKAARLLASADVVLHDALVSREVLALIAPRAELIDVGKRAGKKLLTQDEINSLLIAYARKHGTVIRLKGGDPAVFGRAAEEISALREAQVEYELVPGVTAALGAAAAAGISLTDRRVASQVLFATFTRGADGSCSEGTPNGVRNPVMDWGCVTSTTTLVLYMPGPDYAEIAARLRDAGLPGDFPCVIVSSVSGLRQQILWSNVAALASEEKLPAPALMIIGRVASHHVSEISESFWSHASASLVVAQHAGPESTSARTQSAPKNSPPGSVI